MKKQKNGLEPKGHQDPTFNPDEIPGITTYIYSLNRYREPHEYINHEKFIRKSRENLKELGLNSNIVLEEIVDELKRYKEECTALETNIEELTTSERTAYEKNKQAQRDLIIASKLVTDTSTMAKKYQHFTEKFGDHIENCNYIDLAASGRRANEETACNCGWIEAKKSLNE